MLLVEVRGSCKSALRRCLDVLRHVVLLVDRLRCLEAVKVVLLCC